MRESAVLVLGTVPNDVVPSVCGKACWFPLISRSPFGLSCARKGRRKRCVSFTREEYSLARSGDHMTSIAHSAATIQTSPQSVPATPMWFGEVALIAKHLAHQGIQTAIEQQVRFARRRFGKYDVSDFVVVLIGYALSGEPTLEAFYDHVL